MSVLHGRLFQSAYTEADLNSMALGVHSRSLKVLGGFGTLRNIAFPLFTSEEAFSSFPRLMAGAVCSALPGAPNAPLARHMNRAESYVWHPPILRAV
jgi:hypothetical protein